MIAEAASSDAPSVSKNPQSEKDVQKDTENQDESQNKENITFKGLSAGPTYNPSDTSERNNKKSKDRLPEPQNYQNAPYISQNEFTIQDGDFIRYVKEDGIVYQGTILRGKPVEHGFNYYHGQDDDYVVRLNFDNGKHVGEIKIQQEDKITVMKARQQTSMGRNIETVSPEEIIAVSPDYEYDWYKFEEKWDTEEDMFVREND